MRIQNNIAALNAHRQLGGNNSAVSKNLEKLSSGYRINRAGDDAAGLAISEKMKSQIKGLKTATKNAQDGVSLIQTAEGALTEVHSMLNRMVELATQSSNGTYGEQERGKLQDEVNALREEIDRISEGTNFNGIDLLNGKMDGTKRIGTTEIDLTAGKVNKFSFSASAGSENFSVEFKSIVGTAGATVALDADAGTVAVSIGLAKDASVTQEDLNTAIKTAYDTAIAGAADETAAKKIEDTFKDLKVTLSDDIASDGTAVSGAATDASGAIAAAAAGKALSLQVGDTNAKFQKVNVNVESMSAKSLGLDAIDISTQEGAGNAIAVINAAIEKVSTSRSDLGAIQNRLDHTINNLGVTTENMTAAESRIRDVDMAEEMMQFTKNNILTQASQAMLAQANQLPQGVLQLLQ